MNASAKRATLADYLPAGFFPGQNRRLGRKMAQIIESIDAKSRKARYNPKTDTNWCHLPMELREKCIREMDFMTRTRIRAASRIEKSYVDAYIYHFDKLIFKSETVSTKSPSGPPDVTSCLKFVKSDPLAKNGEEQVIPKLVSFSTNVNDVNTMPFKFCDFKELECYSKGHFLPRILQKWVTEFGPFRFKTLRSQGGNFGLFLYFLRNSWDGVEEIFLDLKRNDDFSIESIFCPSFFKAKKVFIECVLFANIRRFAHQILGEWLKNDVKIGTICHLHTGKIGWPVTGEKTCDGVKMRNDSRMIVIETHLGHGAGEATIKVVRNPDFRPTDAPNGN